MKIPKHAARLFLTLVAVATLFGSTFLLAGCKHMDSAEHGSMQAQQYTYSMHPEVVSTTPGKCPKCGMDLEAKK